MGHQDQNKTLKGSYKAALDTPEDAPLEGNAFSKDLENGDMRNLLTGASLMNAFAGAKSTVSAVTARLTALGDFSDAARQKKKSLADDFNMIYSLMAMERSQAFIEALTARIDELVEEEEFLVEAFERFNNGEFDPRNNEDDAAVLRKIAPDITVDDWERMGIEDQTERFQSRFASINVEKAEISAKLDELAQGETIEVNGKSFADPKYEAARLELLNADPSYTMDVNNLSKEDYIELHMQMSLIDKRLQLEAMNLERTTNRADITAEAPAEMDFSSFLK